MKRLFRVWAVLLVALLFFMPAMQVLTVPVTVQAEEQKPDVNDSTVDPQERCNMIDISSNNGEVDFDSVYPVVKDGGIIIRLGYGSDLEWQDDSQFERNVSECERLGIPYGIYLYSYALDYDEAYSEAEHALRLVKKCNPVLGVYTDYEDADGYRAKNGMVVTSPQNRAKLTQFSIIFVSMLRDNGYTTGVYANSNWFHNVLYNELLEATPGFNRWLAIWGVNEPNMECTIWQFGSVTIDGVEYDGDILYKNKSTDQDNAVPVIEPADLSDIYRNEVDSSINFTYQVQIEGNRWLPWVYNDSDYAGIPGHKITGVAIKTDNGYCTYKVHTTDGKWHGDIDSRNTDTNDYINGYAGTGQPIDAIEVYLYTPSDIADSTGYQCAHYRISVVGNNYYPEQIDDKTDNEMDGYAGSFGKPMDRFQIRSVAA